MVDHEDHRVAAPRSRQHVAADRAQIRAAVQHRMHERLHRARLAPLRERRDVGRGLFPPRGRKAGDAARKYYDPAKATLVIVGDAAKFWNEVKDKRGGVERIVIDDLKLSSPTLK